MQLSSYRFSTEVRVYVDDGSECQPDCRCAAADHQRLDPDAEEGHWRFGVLQPALDRVSWRVWDNDKWQLLAGTGQGLSFAAAWQRQT